MSSLQERRDTIASKLLQVPTKAIVKRYQAQTSCDKARAASVLKEYKRLLTLKALHADTAERRASLQARGPKARGHAQERSEHGWLRDGPFHARGELPGEVWVWVGFKQRTTSTILADQ